MMYRHPHSDDKDGVAAVVLAAGWSSRMGAFKPLLPFGEGTVLSHVIGVLRRAGIVRIHVVIGHRAEIMVPVLQQLAVVGIVNSDFAVGMSGSATVGISSLPDRIEGCLLLPVDLPLLRAESIDRIVRSAVTSGAPIVHPTFRGQRGHPPFVRRSLFPQILAAITEEGLCVVLDRFEPEAREVAVFDRGCLSDMDTPEDHRRLLEMLAHHHLPDAEECEAMMAAADAGEAVRRHCRAVADLAVSMAMRLEEAGVELDVDLARAAALVHDIAKGRPHHAQAGAEIVTEFGYPKIAEVVARHMSIDFGDRRIDEGAVVYLADKLIQGESRVSLEQRFAPAVSRWSEDPFALAGVRKRWADAEAIFQAVVARADRAGLGSSEKILR